VIVSIPAIVWTAVDATFTYFDHISREAAALGATIVDRTASALAVMGKAIVAAVNYLIALVTRDVADALSTAFAGVLTAISTFGSSIATSLSAAVSDTSSGKAVTETHGSWFMDNLTGNLFLAGITLAVAVEIVIGILTPFTLGITFLIPVVIGILLTTALQSLSADSAAHAATPSGVNGFNAKAIHISEGVANSTNPPPKGQSNWSTDWNAIAGAVDWTSSLFGTQLGLGLLAAAYYDGDGLALASVAFGLALVGLALGIAGASTGNRLV
jgi:hypothetical protein